MKKLPIIIIIFLSFVAAVRAQDEAADVILKELADRMAAGQYEEVIDHYLQNRHILEDGSLYESTGYYLLAVVFNNQGYTDDALEAIEKSIKLLDENYDDVVASGVPGILYPYYHHALFAQKAGADYAETLFLKAKKAYEDAGFTNDNIYMNICEELWGYETGDLVGTATGLIIEASEYFRKGEYDKAERGLKKGIRLLESTENTSPRMLAVSYQLLGRIAWMKDDINGMEQCYVKALEYAEPFFGASEEMEEIVMRLGVDLGVVYISVKDYQRAYDVLKKAKSRYEQKGQMGYDYARTLASIATAGISLNKTLEATLYLETAIDIILEEELAQNNDLLSCYSSLIVCYGNMGNYTEAIEVGEKAANYITDNTLPIAIALLYNNLSTVYLKKGDLENAEKHIVRAIENTGNNTIRQMLLFNYAFTRYSLDRKDLLATLLDFSSQIRDEVISNFIFLSEEQRQNFWKESGPIISIFNSMALDKFPDNTSTPGLIYDNAIFSKGLLLRTSNTLADQISRGGDDKDREILQEIMELRNRLEAEDIEADERALYERRLLNSEKELLRNNVTYAGLKKSLEAKWQDIRKSLRKGEVAVEFVMLPSIEGSVYGATQKYAAVVIRHNMKNPVVIALFNEEDFKPAEYKLGRTTSKAKYTTIGQNLYDMVMRPLEPYLRDVSTIYYSPVGVLNTVSFTSFHDSTAFLNDKYALRLLSSTAQLIDMKKKGKGVKIADARVYGGILYDAPETELIAEAATYRLPSNLLASRGIDDDEGERTGWYYLEGTENESREINEKLQASGIRSELLAGVAGNEESFKSLSGDSPSLLHIATHGFFLADERQAAENAFLQGLNPQLPPMRVSMNRSGILLAGANRAWTGEELIEGIEDGILTADEISRMNLGNTDLVVLSACETGLGEVAAAEGVFGLQRAFKLAGVNSLVMSLWKVPDTETSLMMEYFYDNWLSGMERHEAFRRAQQKISEEKPNPYYWAGFVMLD